MNRVFAGALDDAVGPLGATLRARWSTNGSPRRRPPVGQLPYCRDTRHVDVIDVDDERVTVGVLDPVGRVTSWPPRNSGVISAPATVLLGCGSVLVGNRTDGFSLCRREKSPGDFGPKHEVIVLASVGVHSGRIQNKS